MTEIEKVNPQEFLPADPMVAMIERVAMSPDAPIDRLEKMLAMKEKIDLAEAKKSFDAAFSKASARFPEIPLNGLNEHTKKPYALLKDILSAVRPILSEYGLALSFSTEVDKDFVTVTAELSHEGGHSKRNSIPLPRDTGAGRNAVQAVGSSQTYGQRYTAQAILGLSLGMDAEDDGNSSGKIQQEQAPRHTSWAATVTQDLPEDASPREKASAICDALCAQWGRKNSFQQLSNEWDRRVALIEGEKGLEGRYPDLYEKVVDAYEARANNFSEYSPDRMPGDI